MRDLVAQQGATLVFATSFGYLEPALRVAAEFPHARFEHAGGYKSAPNLATYDARYYEARWLAGWLAGRTSKSGVAGYVAGFPVPEVVQGINAFALGMRAANPKATVRVVWLNTWFDPAKERDAAQALIDQGADVLTHHSASPAVAQAAQASFRSRGVRVVSYPSDMRAFAPDAQLAAIVHRWGGFYTRVAERVIDGSWRPEPVWGGIASGMVDIDAVDAALAQGRPRRPADARAPRSSPERSRRSPRRWSTTPARHGWRAARSPTPTSSRWTGSSPASSATCRRRAEGGASGRLRLSLRQRRGELAGARAERIRVHAEAAHRRAVVDAQRHRVAAAGAGGDVPRQQVLVGRVHLDRVRRLAAIGEEGLPVARLARARRSSGGTPRCRRLRAGRRAA